MKELKFRAWGGDTKKFLYIELGPNARIRDNIWRCYSSHDDWEQYTGLKDKNGKEIYEGDIIRICRSYGYGFLPKGAVAVVSYDEDECCYKLKKQGEFRLTSKKMVEVIGNVHENKGLLDD